jgi:tetratricopeptide (TPR) repeat protein
MMIFMRRVLKISWIGLFAAALLLAGGAGCKQVSSDAREARQRHMRRALAAKQRNDIDEASAWCRRALEKDPKLALAHRELALILDNYYEDYVGAIYHYERYLELRPETPNREAVEELIRHCRMTFASQAGAMPQEWQRDLQVRNDRIRELETELAMWRSGEIQTAGAVAAKPAAETKAAAQRPAKGKTKAKETKPAEKPGEQKVAAAQPAAAGRTHVVKPKETLGTIAAQYYGTPNEWIKIFEANRDQLKNPNRIREGLTLVIPEG